MTDSKNTQFQSIPQNTLLAKSNLIVIESFDKSKIEIEKTKERAVPLFQPIIEVLNANQARLGKYKEFTLVSDKIFFVFGLKGLTSQNTGVYEGLGALESALSVH